MRIQELLEAQPIASGFDVEHYGIWTVEMSRIPVKMPAYTGDTRQYVAKATDKRTGKSYIAAGHDQASAREAAIAQGVDDNAGETSSNPDDYDVFFVNFNVAFSREFHNAKASTYFKFIHEGGETFLVRANREYAAAFGSELADLGFHHAHVRRAVSGSELSSPVLSFNLGRSTLDQWGLAVGMRYQVKFAQLDSDENELFSISPISKVQTYHHKERFNTPTFTVNGVKLKTRSQREI